MVTLIIDKEICKSCGLCVSICPKGLLAIDEHNVNSKGYQPAMITDVSQCVACASCATMCPDAAIYISKD